MLVGGYIRDALLDIDSKDIDIELYNIKSFSQLENILEEFGDVNSVGKSFGVCKLRYEDLDLDFSLPRSDSKHSKGHRGFEISIDSSLDFKSASSRRDFTINAMGYDVKSKKILDPFNGLIDLNNSLIRAVDLKKFGEDPLRILRAIQFASRFNFKIDEELFLECKIMVKNSLLEELAKERIFTEIQKLLLKSMQPSLGLKLAQKLNIVNYIGDYSRLDTLDYFALHKSNNSDNDMLTFLSLLYSSKHIYQIYTITDKVKLIEQIKKNIASKKSFPLDSFNDYELYKLAMEVNIDNFSLYLNASYLGERYKEILKMKVRAKELGISTKKALPLIQGRDILNLGIAPSKEYKSILNKAYEAQIKGVFSSTNEAKIWLKESLRNRL